MICYSVLLLELLGLGVELLIAVVRLPEFRVDKFNLLGSITLSVRTGVKTGVPLLTLFKRLINRSHNKRNQSCLPSLSLSAPSVRPPVGNKVVYRLNKVINNTTITLR